MQKYVTPRTEQDNRMGECHLQSVPSPSQHKKEEQEVRLVNRSINEIARLKSPSIVSLVDRQIDQQMRSWMSLSNGQEDPNQCTIG